MEVARAFSTNAKGGSGGAGKDKVREVELPKGLMPVTPSELWVNVRKSTLSAVRDFPKKAMSLARRGVVGASRGIVELVRNPRVAGQWYRQARTGLKSMAHHYWVGSKLLAADIRIAFRLVRKVIRGYQLTRRERKQLINTASDVFRIVPMAAFILIPFMELLLPVALKLFPNLLPSTFQDKLKREENMKRALKAKIEMARFLQDTVEVMATDLRKSSDTDIKSDAKELTQFIEKVRNGQVVDNSDLLRFSELFSDEITLDNMSRPQLVAMCKYMGLSTFGSDPVLRFRLNNRLTSLKNDDKMIYWEGLSSLSTEELQDACMARGMNAKGMSKGQLRQQMSEWLELSMNHRVPSTLLIMSRAFVLTAGVYQALQEAVASLPDEVVETVSMDSSKESTKERERRLELLERQEELIEEEEDLLEQRGLREAEIRDDTLEADLDMALREADLQMSPQKIKQISEAVSVLAAASSVVQEKAELEEIQSDREEVLAKLLASRVLAHGRTTDEMHEQGDLQDRLSLTALGRLGSLDKRLSSLITRLDGEIRQVDEKIGQGFNLIDQDRDGIVTIEELQTVLSLLRDRPKDDAVVQHIVGRLDPDGDGKVNVREIEEAMARLEEMSMLSEEDDEKERVRKEQQGEQKQELR